METNNKDKIKTSEFNLDATSELRIETNSKFTIQLVKGFAEIFGTELTRNKDYTFTNGAKLAVFTWHGCTLLMTGNEQDAYVSKETPMLFYLNIHAALEQMRTKAQETSESRGPRVLVVGPDDVGKSTLCRMLLNWAVRVGHSPVYVDLDVNQNSISLPGTISALIVERTAHVEEGFNPDSQIVYHFGYKFINENPQLYRRLISILIDTINLRSEKIHATLVSGIIINTSGLIRDEGYKSIVHAAREFDVNMILVVDQERLCVDLKKDLPETIKILSLPKSGGVVSKSQELRNSFKHTRIREYFYGFKSNLYPYSFDVRFHDVKIFRIGTPNLPDSLLPVGMSRDDNNTRVYRITPSSSLLNHILSISQATSVDDDSDKNFLADVNIAGFLVVTRVDIDKHSMMVMSTHPKPLPKTILLLSEVQFIDFK